MRKYTQIVYFLVILTLVASCKRENRSGITEAPNIIWFYADDLDQEAISAYGSELITTPNIDRIAEEGMLFRNSFVSNSICAPARAVIQTGLFSHLNGVKGNKVAFDSSLVTFPKVLQAQGYQTALIGKWHLKSVPSGFDHWIKLPGQGNYYDPVFVRNGDTVHTKGYVTDQVGKFALEFIGNQRKEDQPFCLLVQFKAPHSPWMPAPRYLDKFKNDTFPVPETFFADWSLGGKPAMEQDMRIYGTMTRNGTLTKMYDKQGDSIIGHPWLTWLYSLLNKEEQARFDDAYLEENRRFMAAGLTEKEEAAWYYQRYIRDYLRCVAAVDENIGLVLESLDELGLADNTLVMYSSDQGFYLGENGWYDKRFMYDKSMRTPLLARWPAVIQPGTVNDALVQNIDMAETFIDVAGAHIPDQMQGISLLPLMKDPDYHTGRDALYYHYYEFPKPHHVYPHYGIRTETEKLIFFYTIDHWEYYNLGEDPAELVNRYTEPEYSENIKALKKRLQELRIQYGDTIE